MEGFDFGLGVLICHTMIMIALVGTSSLNYCWEFNSGLFPKSYDVFSECRIIDFVSVLIPDDICYKISIFIDLNDVRVGPAIVIDLVEVGG